jgi:hypothetical protein
MIRLTRQGFVAIAQKSFDLSTMRACATQQGDPRARQMPAVERQAQNPSLKCDAAPRTLDAYFLASHLLDDRGAIVQLQQI